MRTSIDKYRREISTLCDKLAGQRPLVRVMEVCGTHTMTIARSGLRSLLPDMLDLISGPGCPVCVTDQSYIDRAVKLAGREDIIIATYGDMVRVPGRRGSLAEARARGARLQVVYSPQQAIDLAKREASSHVVFLAVGFETTAPATALAAKNARDADLPNFSLFTAHKLIPPAMRALLAAGDVRLDAFLCPGHVSVIIGYEAYRQIARDFARPCVVAGFDPPQILAGLAEICRQLVAGRPDACTVYPAVSAEGNTRAKALLEEVFEPAQAAWRGLGTIPASALVLRDRFARWDTAKRFEMDEETSREPEGCRCGDVICGRCRPTDCSLFGQRCTPRQAVGPCMVSSEGACAAAYKYQRR
ncbi:MAG: hydrogenase formation protein HypD [Phycisphaerae bacterium]|nr:hydrogenase formation protein HypD [Phycisphaerae bacterium]